VPSRYRVAYLFRTAPEKSYSVLTPSLVLVGLERFFMNVPFVAGCDPGRNDPDLVRAFTMGNYNQPSGVRVPDEDEAFLAGRVIGVRRCQGMGISEGRETSCLRRFAAAFLGSQVKRNPMPTIYHRDAALPNGLRFCCGRASHRRCYGAARPSAASAG